MYEQNPILYTVNYGDTLYDLAKYYNTSVEDILALNPQIVNPWFLHPGEVIQVIPYYSHFTRYESNRYISQNEFDLTKKMRLVWEQHVYWTRMFIISVAESLKDLDPTTNRLLKNPKDMANVFAPYYGTAVANEIDKLITEHLDIGGNLVKAAKNKNTADVEKYTKDWYKNADTIADTFSKINPYYNKEEVKKMFYSHLNLTTEELLNRLAGKYADDIVSFNKIEQEAMMMADYFVDGIIKQFPDKFRN